MYASDKVVRKIADKIDIGVLEDQRNRRGLMTAKLKVLFDIDDHFFRAIARHPAFKALLAQALGAGGGQDDDAAVLDGELRVVKPFLRLIEIQILRITADGYDDDIRFLGNLYFVQRIEEGAAGPVSLDIMTGKSS